jgi:hypothetical protein
MKGKQTNISNGSCISLGQSSEPTGTSKEKSASFAISFHHKFVINLGHIKI